ncbi:MAG: UDP-N-acetylmuramate dehydrogenase [Chloroflexi bacterium]|nr:UDP-N-acetylmuramate dehydrogenase [Chloroflexota bacterium]
MIDFAVFQDFTLLRDEPLAKYTSARLGGPADAVYVARQSLDELVDVLRRAWTAGIPVRILGGGANVLVSDTGVRGLVVINHVSETEWDLEAGTVRAASGMGLVVLARQCALRGLSGMEWAVSVPGTVGGAVVNNAGAHGGDMAGMVREATLVDPVGEHRLSPEDLCYGYRTSALKGREDRRFLISWTRLQLTRDDSDAITARMEANIAHRKRTQPPGASLGSIFKNPSGDFAGRLIEACGLKGHRIGGAMISPIHANFFINTGDASASDYYALIRFTQATVAEQTGVHLETEIETLGDFPDSSEG